MNKFTISLLCGMLSSVSCMAGLVNVPLSGGPSSLSTKTIYASKAGCALNSNLITGGGTDDRAALQNILSKATSYNSLELIIDGPALISTGLVVECNTKIKFLKGAGLYLASNARCPMIMNHASGTSITLTNFSIEGGFLNANSAGQFEAGTSGTNVFLKSPIFLGGFNGVSIRDLNIYNPEWYFMLFSKGCNLLVENVRGDVGPAGSIHDFGNDYAHFMGSATNYTFLNSQHRGSDDFFAFNTGECIEGRNSDARLLPMFELNPGYQQNIYIDGAFYEDYTTDHSFPFGAFKFYDQAGQVGTNHVCGVVMRNLRNIVPNQLGTTPIVDDLTIDGVKIDMNNAQASAGGTPTFDLSDTRVGQYTLKNFSFVYRGVSGGVMAANLIAISDTQTNVLIQGVTCNDLKATSPVIQIFNKAGIAKMQPFLSISGIAVMNTTFVLQNTSTNGTVSIGGVAVGGTLTSVTNGVFQKIRGDAVYP